MQAWALNRYCYQAAVPRKDAALMSRALDRELRREWVQRLLDHDGYGGEEGGIERWLVLTDALGLDRELCVSMRGALPATRFAAEAYVRFVRESRFRGGRLIVDRTVRAANSSGAHLRHAGELRLHRRASMQYFRRRLDQATRDADFALDYVKRHATTPAQQAACIAAVRFKCNVLWAQLDALHHAYVTPGWIPPGAFCPDTV